MTVRIGFGYDSHQFTEGDHIVIGGEKISFNKGIDAHSDGDVLLHAICDALLGAAGLGDIGQHFPDTNSEFKDISSSHLLQNVMAKLGKCNFVVGNIDCTVILEKPKIAKHIHDIQNNLCKLLNIPLGSTNIKATTNEGMGFIGRSEGVAAYAVAILMQVDNSK